MSSLWYQQQEQEWTRERNGNGNDDEDDDDNGGNDRNVPPRREDPPPQTFAQQLASNLKAVHWAASQTMVQMVRLIDPNIDEHFNSPNAPAWPRPAMELKFCVDEHLRCVHTAQKLYGILGMNEFGYSKTSGCQIMACGDDQFFALGLPPHLRVSTATANDGDDDSIHEFMLPVLNTYGSVQSIRAIAAGGMHSVALTTNGVPYTWGAPDEQQLGRSVFEPDPSNPMSLVTTIDKPRPVVGFVSLDGHDDNGQIHQVAAGEAHTHFVALASGQVYSAGMFRDMATNTFPLVPSDLIEAKQHVVPIAMPGNVPVFSVHSNNNFSAAILKDGTVVTWGTCVHARVGFSFLGLFFCNDVSKLL
jgi:hypothetical protein